MAPNLVPPTNTLNQKHSNCTDSNSERNKAIPSKSQKKPSSSRIKDEEVVFENNNKRKVVDMGLKRSEMSTVVEKVPLFTRVFSDNDEIVILESMIKFKLKKGTGRGSDVVEFHEFIVNMLSCTANASQVSNKIKKLKRRFTRYFKQGKKNSASTEKWYKLSKKIWGGDDQMEVERKHCWSLYPNLCASLESESEIDKNFTKPGLCPKDYAREIVSGIEPKEARKLEEEWKGIHEMELEVYAKRSELIFKQSKAIMDVLKP